MLVADERHETAAAHATFVPGETASGSDAPTILEHVFYQRDAGQIQ